MALRPIEAHIPTNLSAATSIIRCRTLTAISTVNYVLHKPEEKQSSHKLKNVTGPVTPPRWPTHASRDNMSQLFPDSTVIPTKIQQCSSVFLLSASQSVTCVLTW